MAGQVFHYELQVRWSDSDRLGHVNNTRFTEYLQEARVHFMNECLTDVPPGAPEGWTRGATVVRKLTVDFLRPLHDHSGPLDITMDVRHIGTSSFALGHTVRDVAGVVCAEAVAVMVSFDLGTESSRALSTSERAALEEFRTVE